MAVLYIVVPLAFVLAAGAVWAFIKAARQGQFDDLTTPALRVLLDDDPDPPGAGP
jgi:cbb3-type cytochrome oxidase maturation protein